MQADVRKIIEEALRSAQAGIWDGHYSGKGVTVEYAQAVDAEIRKALEVLESSVDGLEQITEQLRLLNNEIRTTLYKDLVTERIWHQAADRIVEVFQAARALLTKPQAEPHPVVYELEELGRWVRRMEYNRDDAPDEIARAIENRVRQLHQSLAPVVKKPAADCTLGEPEWRAMFGAVIELLEKAEALDGMVERKVTPMDEVGYTIGRFLRTTVAKRDDAKIQMIRAGFLRGLAGEE